MSRYALVTYIPPPTPPVELIAFAPDAFPFLMIRFSRDTSLFCVGLNLFVSACHRQHCFARHPQLRPCIRPDFFNFDR